MRVAGIEIRDHPGIGNLKLDFRDSDGRAPRFIVLAGGNGCGKTAVLEAIFACLIPVNLLLNLPDVYAGGSVRLLIEHDFELNHFLFQDQMDDLLFHEMRSYWRGFVGIVVDLDWERPLSGMFNRSISNTENNTTQSNISDPAAILNNPMGCFLSVANTVFQVPPIRSVTAMSNPSQVNVPATDAYPLFGTSALASIIPQLFVDLESADGLALNRWRRDNPGRDIPADLGSGRIQRFEEAFAQLIPQKRFTGISAVNGELVPQFSEYGRNTPLAKLSTGEKQIVFRGAFLLRQAEHMPGAVVMIDEPELSLHPNWQSGILDYYDRIVSESEEKKSQVILATHSPFVVHGSPLAKHVVLRRDSQTGIVGVDERAVFPGVTPEAVAIAAFDFENFIFLAPSNNMVVATEGKTDAQMIRLAWEKRRPGRSIPFNLMPSGSAGMLRFFLGHEPNTPGPLADALADRGIDRILGVFDFDKEGHGYWNKGRNLSNIWEEDLTLDLCPWWRRSGTNIWSALLPVPSHRPTAAGLGDGTEATSILTTELLFEDGYLEGMVRNVQVRHAPLGVSRPDASNTQKSEIVAAAQTFPPDAFESFEPLLTLIEDLLVRQT